jgi:hypothetical protein
MSKRDRFVPIAEEDPEEDNDANSKNSYDCYTNVHATEREGGE